MTKPKIPEIKATSAWCWQRSDGTLALWTLHRTRQQAEEAAPGLKFDHSYKLVRVRVTPFTPRKLKTQSTTQEAQP